MRRRTPSNTVGSPLLSEFSSVPYRIRLSIVLKKTPHHLDGISVKNAIWRGP
jgi:hypothetical protein